MKNITKRMLQDGLPVWMGCGLGKQMHRWKGLWDANNMISNHTTIFPNLAWVKPIAYVMVLH